MNALKKQLIVSCTALLAAVPLCQATLPSLYHYVWIFPRSLSLSQGIAYHELEKAGFKIVSGHTAKEQVGVNADTWVVVTNVGLANDRTYVHVIATSDTDASAKKWAAQIMEAIKNSKAGPID